MNILYQEMSSANESGVKQLVAMGFPEDEAVLALNRTGNNVELAVEYLSNGSRCYFMKFDCM